MLPSHWSRLQPNRLTLVYCEICGSPVWRKQPHMKRVKHHFCSQSCEGVYSQRTGRRRGSMNGHYNTVTVPCAGCGVPISKAKSLIFRRQNRVYCPQCLPKVTGHEGFYVGYPKAFSPALRREIRKRDSHTCQLCGAVSPPSRTLHVHHIDYVKTNCDPMNLISLCHKCHGDTHFGLTYWTIKLSALMSQRFPMPLAALHGSGA